jgi:hypothetical protein
MISRRSHRQPQVNASIHGLKISNKEKTQKNNASRVGDVKMGGFML